MCLRRHDNFLDQQFDDVRKGLPEPEGSNTVRPDTRLHATDNLAFEIGRKRHDQDNADHHHENFPGHDRQVLNQRRQAFPGIGKNFEKNTHRADPCWAAIRLAAGVSCSARARRTMPSTQ